MVCSPHVLLLGERIDKLIPYFFINIRITLPFFTSNQGTVTWLDAGSALPRFAPLVADDPTAVTPWQNNRR